MIILTITSSLPYKIIRSINSRVILFNTRSLISYLSKNSIISINLYFNFLNNNTYYNN